MKEDKVFEMEMEDMYTENTKYHWKELKKTQFNGKTPHVHGLKEFIRLKCP